MRINHGHSSVFSSKDSFSAPTATAGFDTGVRSEPPVGMVSQPPRARPWNCDDDDPLAPPLPPVSSEPSLLRLVLNRLKLPGSRSNDN
jgi:hypothetical protein